MTAYHRRRRRRQPRPHKTARICTIYIYIYTHIHIYTYVYADNIVIIFRREFFSRPECVIFTCRILSRVIFGKTNTLLFFFLVFWIFFFDDNAFCPLAAAPSHPPPTVVGSLSAAGFQRIARALRTMRTLFRGQRGIVKKLLPISP